MINNEAFIHRLEKILEHYGLSASAFADSLGVQRSGLSHLLSGRNKPSLDFVLKLLHTYPEVDLQWLMNGKGVFPKESTEKKEIFSDAPESQSEQNSPIVNPPLPAASSKPVETGKRIKEIVIFYEDGTFNAYSPR